MENVEIKATIRTPKVVMNKEKGLIELEGKSISENPRAFYEPLLSGWVADYLRNPEETTNVSLKLEYYNTSSSMWILRILKELEKLYTNGKKVVINWVYSDEDGFESGSDYDAIIKIPFNMIEIREEDDGDDEF